MRKCPNCSQNTISIARLIFQRYIPGVVADCSNCYSIIDLKGDSGSLFSAVTEEWILLGLLLLSFIYSNVLWFGVAGFVLWRYFRLYLKTRGELVVVPVKMHNNN